MLGGVPMPVVNPPSSELKASGISSFDGGRPVRRAMSMITGSKSAATPTLFMKADMKAATAMIRTTSNSSLLPASRRT